MNNEIVGVNNHTTKSLEIVTNNIQENKLRFYNMCKYVSDGFHMINNQKQNIKRKKFELHDINTKLNFGIYISIISAVFTIVILFYVLTSYK